MYMLKSPTITTVSVLTKQIKDKTQRKGQDVNNNKTVSEFSNLDERDQERGSKMYSTMFRSASKMIAFFPFIYLLTDRKPGITR